jgi:putative Mn2+ efflux pump MntP
MSIIEILFVSLGLAMDAFAVSLAAGTHRQIEGFRPAFRLWFHFGLFQCLMTVAGWFLAAGLGRRVMTWDHWVAFVLLSVVGGKMIKEGFECAAAASENPQNDPSRGLSLMSLSIGTSLDAMAVGVSLGMMKITIWEPSAVIGLVTALLSLVGLRIGRYLGAKFGKCMEVIGGVVLLIIAIKILLTG